MTGREAVLALVNLRTHAHLPCHEPLCILCTAREYLFHEWPDEYKAFHIGVAQLHRGE